MRKGIDRKEDLRTKLRQRGYKVTLPRILILDILSNAKSPLSTFDLYERTKRSMNRSTVYRVLDVLISSELVRRIDFRHDHPHYEINLDDDHHHIICLSCGYSEDIDCKLTNAEESLLSNSKKFAEVKEHSLEFYGYCKNCSN